MTRFDRVLSDDDLLEIATSKGSNIQKDEYGVFVYGGEKYPIHEVFLLGLLRAVDVSVQMRLAEQEPVAWRVWLEDLQCWSYSCDYHGCGEPLYAHPMPTNSAQIPRNLIRALALKNGFTLKGEDLHEYVYNFANELASVVADSALFDKSTKNHIPDIGKMVPEGWQLVPVEITAEMLRDAHIRSELGAYAVSNLSEGYSLIRNLYGVLVASAPKYTGESK